MQLLQNLKDNSRSTILYYKKNLILVKIIKYILFKIII